MVFGSWSIYKFSTSRINEIKKEDEKKKNEDEIMNDYKLFVEKYDTAIKKFAFFSKMKDSEQFLIENTHLGKVQPSLFITWWTVWDHGSNVRCLNCIWPEKVNEHTASRLCIFSIDLQVEEKFDLVDRVSHQAIVLQFILELAKSLKIDPRGCFRQFFIKFAQTDNPEYHKAFNDELEAFRGNIRPTWLL